MIYPLALCIPYSLMSPIFGWLHLKYSCLFARSFLDISGDVHQIIISPIDCDDQLVRSLTDSGNLSFKDAYKTLYPIGLKLNWSKKIWSVVIPPSKSFLVWRLFHNKSLKMINYGIVCVWWCHVVGCALKLAYETITRLFFLVFLLLNCGTDCPIFCILRLIFLQFLLFFIYVVKVVVLSLGTMWSILSFT